MSVSLTQVGNALAVVLAPPTTMDPTPRHHANTVTLLLRQESDWFDNSQLVEIIDLMCKDQSAADTYLALSEASVHWDWICAQLPSWKFYITVLWIHIYDASTFILIIVVYHLQYHSLTNFWFPFSLDPLIVLPHPTSDLISVTCCMRLFSNGNCTIK